ncbi:MAG TPA: hypothetical protein VJZ32_00370 [Candidatus Bathyarchaeia archaeon]|nr:hypothetical protein [Candidatus Bathyarchaeia archaeon]HKM78207.1 hypothetical protein [Candidatus Bathyarchaeia archaeon]
MEFRKQIKISYSLTVIGIVIEAYVTLTNYIRSLMFRSGGYTRGAFSGAPRQYGLASPIGVVGMTIAIIGALWLGYTIAKQFKTHPKPRT